jgi:hypothetical protein
LFSRITKAKNNNLKKEKVAVKQNNKSGSFTSSKLTLFAEPVAKPAITTFTPIKSTASNLVFKHYFKSIKRSASINTVKKRKKEAILSDSLYNNTSTKEKNTQKNYIDSEDDLIFENKAIGNTDDNAPASKKKKKKLKNQPT